MPGTRASIEMKARENRALGAGSHPQEKDWEKEAFMALSVRIEEDRKGCYNTIGPKETTS